ncbi:MAG: flagellar hook-basal body complex protein FliE [Desulfovibrionaceae bacterium]|nr:flagellar hook-basal body complex protein FliE [Desulfovibrionaceae bacterium]MDD4953090.1 flagellar hook-basal body complex protein FliE [Desulfovibrionaceae bacterium]
MTVKSVALDAYRKAVDANKAFSEKVSGRLDKLNESPEGFMDALKDSLDKVNETQAEKNSMIEAFASGKQQNVHELMISIQKAELAMSMTSAVRTKILNAYQEIMRMPF